MNKDEKKPLEELYDDPEIGFTSKERFYQNVKDMGYTRREVKEFYNTLPVAQIHNEDKPAFLPIEVSGIKEQYQIDLVVLIKGQKRVSYLEFDRIKVNELRYVMTLIDVYSRKADCRFIKNKTASLTLQALKEMIEVMGKPKQISGDKGKEWGGVFKQYCEDNKIMLTLKDKDGKFSNGIIERFDRTLVGYIKNYKTVHPVKGINQLARGIHT